MSVIIRLQNLPWSANAYDIRQFFQGLSIPEGGVHIVGGEMGDSFIAFSTDEDARQAMMRSGSNLKEAKVQLLLSSRSEMQKVIEAAQTVTFPPTQPAAPQIAATPVKQPPNDQMKKYDKQDDQRNSRRRSRSSSRSRDRKSNRRDSRDSSRRRRSRSRSRSRDRRRKKSHSTRDRYSRDRDKRVKEENSPTIVDNSRKSQPAPIEQGKPTAFFNNFGTAETSGSTNLGTAPSFPFKEDLMATAMRKTLNSVNIPFNLPDANPMVGGDSRLAQDRRNNSRNGRELSPVRSGFNDINPLLANQALNIPGLSELLFQGQNLPLVNNPSNKPSDANSVWLTPHTSANSLASIVANPAIANLAAAVLPNLPIGLSNLSGINSTLLDNLRRSELPEKFADRFPNNDVRGSLTSRADQTKSDERNVSNSFDREHGRHSYGFGNEFDNMNARNSKPDDFQGRAMLERDEGVGSFGQPRLRKENENESRVPNVCVELIGLKYLAYREIRRAFANLGCSVDEIRSSKTPGYKRIGAKFNDTESKFLALDASGRLRIEDQIVDVLHMPDIEFYRMPEDTFRERYNREELSKESRTESGFEPHKNSSRDPPRNFRDNRDRTDDHRRDVPDFKNGLRSRFDEPVMPMPLPVLETDCVIINNMPRSTTDRDLCDFFSDIGITPKKMHLMLDTQGEPSGEAYVEFWSPNDAKLSCTKNGAPMGRVNVALRLVARNDMLQAVGIVDEAEGLAPPPPLIPKLDMISTRPVMPPFPMMGPGMGPRPGFMFNPRPRFRGPRPLGPPIGGPPPGNPQCTVTMNNVPYRAEIEEILAFFPAKFELTPMEIFRKMNDRNQATSEARVVMKTPELAREAVDTLSYNTIRGRNISLGILAERTFDKFGESFNSNF